MTVHVSGRYLLISTALWARKAISRFKSFTNNKFEYVSKVSSRYGSISCSSRKIVNACSTSEMEENKFKIFSLLSHSLLTPIIVMCDRNLGLNVNIFDETRILQLIVDLQAFIVQKQVNVRMSNENVFHPVIGQV